MHAIPTVYRISISFLFLGFLSIVLYEYAVYSFTLFVLYLSTCFVDKQFKETLPVDGKAVLITGCDTGFGYYLAIRLVGEGFTVFAGVLSTDSSGASDLSSRKQPNLHVLQLDVTKDDDINNAVKIIKEKAGGLWGVVNNAGLEIPGDVELCLTDHFRFCQEINLNGPIAVTKAVLPMIRRSKGRIVNVSSVAGRFAWPRRAPYTITKYGLEAFSDTLRLEMKKFGVQVSIIEPGHFAHATHITGRETCARVEKNVAEMWDGATEEVQNDYGKEYVDIPYKLYLSYMDSYDANNAPTIVTPVIDAFVDAVINVNPLPRYLIGGGFGWYDPLKVYAIFYQHLPEWFTDFVIGWLTRGLHIIPPLFLKK